MCSDPFAFASRLALIVEEEDFGVVEACVCKCECLLFLSAERIGLDFKHLTIFVKYGTLYSCCIHLSENSDLYNASGPDRGKDFICTLQHWDFSGLHMAGVVLAGPGL